MNKIKILGIGTVLPKNEILSSDLDKELNFENGTIEKITGLHKRYFIKDDDPSELLLNAIEIALKKANLSIDEIDCIIQSGALMEQAIPYNAAGTHRLLNLKRPIPSFDINMTCLSVLRIFDIASNLFNSYKNILIVSVDVHSVGLDFRNIRTAGIFGDGVSAMIVSNSNSGGILLSNFETYPEGYDYCEVKGCGTKRHPLKYKGDYKELGYFEMNGKKMYKIASQIVPKFIYETLSSKNLTLNDIDYIVPHQTSQGSLDHIIKLLNIDKTKFINIFKDHGNQVASSIPFALNYLFENYNLKSGQKIMLVGTSAGLGLGLIVWQVP